MTSIYCFLISFYLNFSGPAKLFRKNNLDKETFRSDSVSDLGILSKLKSDLEKLKTAEPAKQVIVEIKPVETLEVEALKVESLDDKPAETKEISSTTTTTTTATSTSTTITTSTTTSKPEKSSTEELVNLDLESFDHSEEEPEMKVDLERPEVRTDDDEASFFQDNCGRLGGSAVLQAFGRAAHNLLPGSKFF